MSQVLGQHNYKQVMQNPQVNFYDVCADSELNFQSRDPMFANTNLIQWKLDVAKGMYFVKVEAYGKTKIFKLRKD